MVEARVRRDVVEAPHRATLGVGASVDDARDARLHEGAGAHDAGLEGDVERETLEVPTLAKLRRAAQGDDLRVGRCVEGRLAQVHALGDDGAARVDDDSPDRNLAAEGCLVRQMKTAPDVELIARCQRIHLICAPGTIRTYDNRFRRPVLYPAELRVPDGRTGCSRFTVLVNMIVHEPLDRHALPRLFDELVWSLRRSGVAVAPSQVIDWMHAVDGLGLGEKLALRDAFVAVVAKERRHVPVVERVFDRFFGRERLRGDLFERLRARGLAASEERELRDLVQGAHIARDDGASTFMAVVGRGAAFDRLLGLAGAFVDRVSSSSVARGWVVEQARAAVGMRAAKDALAALEARLVDAFGAERGAHIAALLRAELSAAEADVKGMVDARRHAHAERQAAREQKLATRTLAQIPPEERDKVRRAVKLVAEKMAGAERVRRRHARRGRFDARGTVRLAFRLGGVPMVQVFRRRRRTKPRLIVLCDISDSVRGASELLLEFMQSTQAVFPSTRSFVFVRDLGEATELLARSKPEHARERIAAGAVVPVTENSSYGRVLRLFLERHGREVDKRTTIVILGDGRTNWTDDGSAILEALRMRARALVWLCPEPRSQWSVGDSAMARFAPRCTEVLDVSSVEALAQAAQRLRRLRA